MKARHQVSRNAVELIKRFEGYRANAAQLANGRWTIGYGHTLTAREGASVSQSDAEALLMYDLIAVAHAVNEQTYAPLNQNQFDALVSFAFNIGIENFQRSAVLRRINEGALIQAACAMEMWRKADFGGERIVIDALVRRRSAEKHLFLTPPDGWVAAPSPILPPKVDYDASYAVPRQAPAPVVAPLDGERAEAHLDRAAIAVPVPPEEDLEPSASERAAAQVSARLQTLLPDETEAPVAPAPPPPPETGLLDMPPMPEPAPAPEASEPQAPAPVLNAAWPAPYVEPTLEEQEALRSVAAAPPAEPEASPSWTLNTDDRDPVSSLDPEIPLDAKPGSTKAVPLLMLAGVSLVLFGGGVFGALDAAADNSGSLLTARAISWALCLAGAVGLVCSAYLLLRLIDTTDD